jgi:hypothetical protein
MLIRISANNRSQHDGAKICKPSTILDRLGWLRSVAETCRTIKPITVQLVVNTLCKEKVLIWKEIVANIEE